MSYDLGTAHGKIDLDYEGGREAAQAQEDIEELRRKLELADEQARKHDSTMKMLTRTMGTLAKTAALVGASSLLLNGSLNAVAATMAGLAALAPVVGAGLAALPGIVLGIAATLAVFKVATAGVGEALKAATGDAEAFNEAIKGLSPSAQAFARSWRSAIENLRPLQQLIQETFFSGLSREVDLVAKRVQLLRINAVRLADAMNQVARRFTEWLRSDTAIRTMNSSLEFARDVLINMDGAIKPLLDSFGRLAQQAGRFGQDLGGAIAAGMLRLAAFLDTVDLADLFERASAAVQGLWGWLQDVWVILGAIWGLFNVDGANALGIIGEMTSRLAEFLQTAEGQAALEALGLAMQAIAGAAGQVFLALLKALAPAIIALAPGIGEFATILANTLVPALEEAAPLLEAFARFLSDNMEWVGPLAIALGGLTVAYKAYTAAMVLANAATGTWSTLAKALVPITRTLTAANLSLAASFLLNPYVLAAVAIAALITAIVLIATKTDWFQRLWNWAWGGIKDAAKAVADWFTGTVVPAFSGAWDSIVGFFTGARDKVVGVLNAVKDGAQAFWDEISFIFEGIGRVAQSAWGLIVAIVETSWKAISAVFAVFQAIIEAIFRPVLEALVALFQWAWSGIQGAITKVVDFLKPYLDEAWAYISGKVQAVMDWISEIFSAGWEKVKAAFEAFWEPIQPYVQEAMDFVVGIVQGGWDKLVSGAKATWEAIKTAATGFWTFLKNLFTTSVNQAVAIFDGLTRMVENVGVYFDNLKAAADGGIGDLIAFVTAVPRRVLSALGNFGSLLYNSGRNLIAGLINGINDMAGRLWDRAQDIANGILDTFSSIFRLGSPSKATYEFGQFLMFGLTNGLESLMARLQRVSETVAQTALPVLPTVAGSAGVNASFVGHAERAVLAANATAPAASGGVTINNLNVQGVWDFTDPTAMRRMVATLHEELAKLEGEYR